MSTLMVSISGIRGIVGDGLDPETLIKYTNAFADFVGSGKVIIGRDARITGEMVNQIVTGTLLSKGLDVVDIGICPTPTVQFTVKSLNAQGGIAISASHNPNEWNALKLLNKTGQFMSPIEHEIMKRSLDQIAKYADWQNVGKRNLYTEAIDHHIQSMLELPVINISQIRNKKYRVLVDCVNGAGVYCIPKFLEMFDCEIIKLNCEKTGIFPRLPEPLPENLTETMLSVKKHNADFAVVVDPDVDRLVLITDNGEPFIEENTVALATDFILSRTPGNVVVNLSTTRAVDVIAKKYNCEVFRSAVGEANVVQKMKEVNAIIGGEGSGGVIYPALHYGRDAMLGIGLLLQYLTDKNKKLSEIKAEMPQYFISKKKIDLGINSPDLIIQKLIQKYSDEKINTDDGLRIDFEDHWVHFRKSNTEPIIRVIVESSSEINSKKLIDQYFEEVKRELSS